MLPPTSDKLQMLEESVETTKGGLGHDTGGEIGKVDLSDVEDFWLECPPPYDEAGSNEDSNSGSSESSPTHDGSSSQDEELIQPENTAWLTSGHPASRVRPRSRTIARLLEPENTSWVSSERIKQKGRPRSSTTFAQQLDPENTAWVSTQRTARTRARASTFSFPRAEMLDGDNRAWVKAHPILTQDSILSRAKAHIRESLSPSSSRSPSTRTSNPFSFGSHSVNAGDLLIGDNTAWVSNERLAKRTRGRASTVSNPIAQPLEGESKARVSPKLDEDHESRLDGVKTHFHRPNLSPIPSSPVLSRLLIPQSPRARSHSRSPGSAASQSSQYLTVPLTREAELLAEGTMSSTESAPPVSAFSPVKPVISAISALKSPTRMGRRATISHSAAEMARP